jgi:hypothetical protein
MPRKESPEALTALDADAYLAQLNENLTSVMAKVGRRVPQNSALTIDRDKGKFHLAALKGKERPDAVKVTKGLIQGRLAKTDLVDVLIDLDNQTNFLRHFLHQGGDSGLSPRAQRRNALAALIAIGCNIGPQRMAVASGLSIEQISFVADWHLTEDALKAASIDLINFASRLPMSRIYGRGNTCSADGMRFCVPVNILAADYSHVLQGRGVTLYAHTADNCLASINSPSLAVCARQHSVSTAYWNTIRNSIPGFATPTPTVSQKWSWQLPRCWASS